MKKMSCEKSPHISRLRLIAFGLKIGYNSFLHGDHKIALKRIILPINYWRVAIFRIVANYILQSDHSRRQHIRILDIGSPKLLSLFLASNTNGKIYATDLQDETLFTEWKKHYQNMSHRGNIIFEFANAKQLQYPDKYFDIIYSLSVIHMITPAEEGDILALREMQKKIKPGGLLIIEVAYRKKYTVNYANKANFEERYHGQPLFKERQYDEVALEKRITNSINGRLVHKTILYEKLPFDGLWNKVPKFISRAFAFIEPWADITNISIAKNGYQLAKARSAILIYEIRG